MKKRKEEKYLDLSAYNIDFDKKNLFDDEYGQCLRDNVLISDELRNLNEKNLINCLKYGRNLLELLDDNPTYANLNRIINTLDIPIGKTQAIKYIEAFNYFNDYYQKKKSTENLEILGIEKLYLLTTVVSQLKREELEKFIIDNNLTVKELSQLIKIINGKDKIYEIAVKFFKKVEESKNNPFVSCKKFTTSTIAINEQCQSNLSIDCAALF